MKKYLSYMLIGLAAVLPFGVKAATTIDRICSDVSDGTKKCIVTAETTETTLTVKLTEFGGADITEINGIDWTVSSQNEDNGVWTIVLTGLDGGEISLFSFTYKVSGTEDCKIEISLGNQTVSTPPSEDPTTPPTTDKPADPEKTGPTLPYIALGAIALIAGGAYVATKNKTKMYRL